jgi:hypothetical protein
MQGRTLLKWGRSPFGDLFVCANNLFAAAIGHYKLVRPDFKSGHQHSFAEGHFTERHKLARKWRVPKAMIGRRLSQDEDTILTPRPVARKSYRATELQSYRDAPAELTAGASFGVWHY